MKQNTEQSQSKKGGFNTMKEAFDHTGEGTNDKSLASQDLTGTYDSSDAANRSVTASAESDTADWQARFDEISHKVGDFGTMIRGKLPAGTKMAWALAAGLILGGGTYYVLRNRRSSRMMINKLVGKVGKVAGARSSGKAHSTRASSAKSGRAAH